MEHEASFRSVMAWLNANSGAVTALAAVAGVLVATVYAFFTVLLWRATKAQAVITRHVFEASHRPDLVVEVLDTIDTIVHGRLSCRIVLTNRGTVPGHITAWSVQGTVIRPVTEADDDVVMREQPAPIDHGVTPVGMSLEPSKSGAVVVEFAHPSLPFPFLFRLRGRIEYRGVASWTYVTEFSADRNGPLSWTVR